MRRLSWICLALAAVGSLSASLHAAEPEHRADPPTIQLTPAPPSAAHRELMRRWHRDWRGRLSPILREWEGLARAARARPGSRLAAGCRRLDLALARLDRGRLPASPDPSVSLHLEETLRSLTEAAHSCTHGAYFLTTWRLQEAAASWRELRGRLLLYGLSP